MFPIYRNPMLDVLGYFLNSEGELYSAAAVSGWRKRERVDLDLKWKGTAGLSEITEATMIFWGSNSAVVRAPHNLLEKFLALADGSDKQIHRFALTYGALHIFQEALTAGEKTRDFNREFCAIWRYLARAMAALLRICADLRNGRATLNVDWKSISSLPDCMRYPYADHWRLSGAEINFMVNAAGVDLSELNRHLFIHLLNLLLELAQVRPQVQWSESAAFCGPEVLYSQNSLLSYLVLQFCLSTAGMTSMAVCSHCRKQYSVESDGEILKRRPKAGQRSFCLRCRKAGMPAKYALADYRARKRSSACKR